MRTAFPGYYRPTASAFDELWESALIAVDANVLLNLYRYSPATRKNLLRLFDRVGDRLWMPHQFAFEFQRNRVKVIIDQLDAYKSVERQLKDVINNHLTPKRRHPFLTAKSMDALATIRDELDKGRLRHERLLSDDSVHDGITRLLTNRVGPAPTDQELNKLYDDARRRYESRTPPGYSDMKKPEPEKFGDYIGWRQILDYCSANNFSLIFITDDFKDDWWHTHKDRKIGPRPELVTEYMDACRKPFYMYSLEQFTRFARGRFGSRLGSAALEEIHQRWIERTAPLMLKSAHPLSDLELDDHAKESEANEKGDMDAAAGADPNELDVPKERGE